MLSADEIVRLKERSAQKLAIEIKDENDHFIGSLLLLQKGDDEDAIIVGSITKWRNKFMSFFLTQFTATAERTKSWLNDIVIPSPERLFFLIYDQDDNLLGNFGVANICGNQCELDNLIRGEKGGHPRLIYFSEVSLLKWLFIEQGFVRVYLHVFSNNSPTIKLHTKVGFTEINRKKMFKYQDHNGEISFRLGAGNSCLTSIEYVEMEIDFLKFSRMNFNDGRGQ